MLSLSAKFGTAKLGAFLGGGKQAQSTLSFPPVYVRFFCSVVFF